MLNSEIPSNFFPASPPTGLTQEEFQWFIDQKLNQDDHVSSADLVELLVSYDVINSNKGQGLVLREWIKQTYAREHPELKDTQALILNDYGSRTSQKNETKDDEPTAKQSMKLSR